MAKAIYIDINESTKEVAGFQNNIMAFVEIWVKKNNTPVPKVEIIRFMEETGTKDFQTHHALDLLLRKGYIRRAITMTNKTSYVKLRSVILHG